MPKLVLGALSAFDVHIVSRVQTVSQKTLSRIGIDERDVWTELKGALRSDAMDIRRRGGLFEMDPKPCLAAPVRT